MNTLDRINRVLLIMSFVSQNQGVPVEDLAAKVSMEPSQLLKELEFILLIGKPPFQPDDYVDIYVEDDRVYIEFDQMLNRPLRFSRPEAVALLMSLQLLDPQVDPEGVNSLKKKIQEAIGTSEDPLSRLQERIAFEPWGSPVSRHFSLLREAIEKNRKVEIDYYSLTQNRTERRNVRPHFLTKSLGYWYLTGYCELRQDMRTFKFERILSVQPLQEGFAPPQDLESQRHKNDFLKLMGRNRVEIHFAPAVAAWIEERWGSATRKADDGGVILTLFSETLEFPSRLVLEHAPHARPLNPSELVEKVRRDAAAVAALYEAHPVA